MKEGIEVPLWMIIYPMVLIIENYYYNPLGVIIQKKNINAFLIETYS